jgi:hypothetical protein
MDLNLCCYDHPKYVCGAKEKDARQACKFYHPNCKSDCGNFDVHGCGDCNHIGAQFEVWALRSKPEAVRHD